MFKIIMLYNILISLACLHNNINWACFGYARNL